MPGDMHPTAAAHSPPAGPSRGPGATGPAAAVILLTGCLLQGAAGPSLAAAAAPGACSSVPVFAGGRRSGAVCRSAAPSQGLTVLDLSDSWTPRLFGEAPERGDAGQQPYRARLLQLADERLGP